MKLYYFRHIIRQIIKFSLIISSLFGLSCKNTSTYEIDHKNFKVLKSPVTWISDKITGLMNESEVINKEFGFDNTSDVPSYFSGLTPSHPMLLGYYLNRYDKSGIIRDGGLFIASKCLVVKDNDKYILIDSKAKAIIYFSPIQSKQEAISYLALLTHSYPIYDFNFVKDRFNFNKTILNKTYVDSLSTGYLVHLFEYSQFGCNHPYWEITYRLNFDGTFYVIKKEEIFRDPKEDGHCVD